MRARHAFRIIFRVGSPFSCDRRALLFQVHISQRYASVVCERCAHVLGHQFRIVLSCVRLSTRAVHAFMVHRLPVVFLARDVHDLEGGICCREQCASVFPQASSAL